MANVNRLKEKYTNEVIPALIKEYGYKNVNEVPKLEKIVLNMGLGDVKDNSKSFNLAFVTTGFWPAKAANSFIESSINLELEVASPTPILITTFSILGACIIDEYLYLFINEETTSFLYFSCNLFILLLLMLS